MKQLACAQCNSPIDKSPYKRSGGGHYCSKTCCVHAGLLPPIKPNPKRKFTRGPNLFNRKSEKQIERAKRDTK